MFAVSRFSHYLKCMVRDKIGATKEAEQLQRWLQSWINHYVDGDPRKRQRADQGAQAPGCGAKVEVFEDEENPGYYMGALLSATALPARRHGYRHEPRLVSQPAQGQVTSGLKNVDLSRRVKDAASYGCRYLTMAARHVHQDRRHQGRIPGQVPSQRRSTSWPWTGAHPVRHDGHTGGGGGGGKVNGPGHHFTKYVDRATQPT